MLLLLLLALGPAALSKAGLAAAAVPADAVPAAAAAYAVPPGPAGDWTEGCRDFTYNECERVGNFQVGW